MIKNNKGLSAIITTLLIVLLVLVAVGIVWAVVRNMISTGAAGVDISAKCLNIDVRANAASCASAASCNVTIKRTGASTDEIEGLKLIFRNSTAGTNSGILDEAGDVELLVGKELTTYDTGMTDMPDSIEVTVYFKDASGNEKYCPQTTYFDF